MKRTGTPVRCLGGLCVSAGLPWPGLRAVQRGLDFSAAVTCSVCCAHVETNPKHSSRAEPGQSHTSSALRGVSVALLGPGCHRLTKRPWSRRHALHQSSQQLSRQSWAARSRSARPHKCHRHHGMHRKLPQQQQLTQPHSEAEHGPSLAHGSPMRQAKGLPSSSRTLMFILLSLPTFAQPCHPLGCWVWVAVLSCDALGAMSPVPRTGLFWGKGNTAPPQPRARPRGRGGTAGLPGGAHNKNKTNPETQIRGKGCEKQGFNCQNGQ